MRRTSEIIRLICICALFLPLFASCQTAPPPVGLTSANSSMLAVDVVFPARMSRDPSLVQAWFAKDGAPDELPEFVPATFVKWSRAYLLDPEPGTYSLVAVSSALDPPWNANSVAGGVTQSRYSKTTAYAMIFPAELIHQTRTAVAAGHMSFMGALRIQKGDPVDADVQFEDDLQQRIARRIRPNANSEKGFARWFPRAWTIDLAASSISRNARDRESFIEVAVADLGISPWGEVVARSAPAEAQVARRRAQSRVDEPRPPTLEPVTRPSPTPTPTPPPTPTPIAEQAAITKPDAEPISEDVIPESAQPETIVEATESETVYEMVMPEIPMPEIAISEIDIRVEPEASAVTSDQTGAVISKAPSPISEATPIPESTTPSDESTASLAEPKRTELETAISDAPVHPQVFPDTSEAVAVPSTAATDPIVSKTRLEKSDKPPHASLIPPSDEPEPVLETATAIPPQASPVPQAAQQKQEPAPEGTPNEPRHATLVPGPTSRPVPPARIVEPRRFSGLPPDSPLADIEYGMSHHDVRRIMGDPDGRADRITMKAWIPFYMSPGGYLRDWIYDGEGLVVFTLHRGALEVVDVIAGSKVGR